MEKVEPDYYYYYYYFLISVVHPNSGVHPEPIGEIIFSVWEYFGVQDPSGVTEGSQSVESH